MASGIKLRSKDHFDFSTETITFKKVDAIDTQAALQIPTNQYCIERYFTILEGIKKTQVINNVI